MISIVTGLFLFDYRTNFPSRKCFCVTTEPILSGHFYIVASHRTAPHRTITFYRARVETKESLDSLELRGVENAKIACAKKHFEAICGDDVKYDIVTSFENLVN